MHDILSYSLQTLIASADRAELDVAALARGLSFDPRALPRRVAWEDYCTFLERMEEVLGGPEPLAEVLASSYHGVLPRPIRAIFGAFVSPHTLMRFCYEKLNWFYPAVEIGCSDLPDGRMRLWGRLRGDARASLAFFEASVAVARTLPTHLGLPAAEVVVDQVSPRSVVLVATLPKSKTLLAQTVRGGRAALYEMADLVAQLVGDGSSLARRLEQIEERMPPEPDVRLSRQAARLGLTRQQTRVLGLVVEGLSNKEIAVRLQCSESTVEAHLTQIMRKSAVDSRSLLIARFYQMS